jgi:acyl-CoA reductase-like NAD-dependent aldehyde dehydrogenase/nicotinamidase-related amidase
VEAEATRLLEQCREAGIPVAHVHMSVDPDEDNRMAHWKESDRWTCAKGTGSAEAPCALRPLLGEAVFHKSVFSAVIGTELLDFLRDEAIDVLWIAGIHTHTCVRQSALDVYQMGFRTVLCVDALGSNEPALAAQSLLYLRERGISLRRTAELFSMRQAHVEVTTALSDMVDSEMAGVMDSTASLSARTVDIDCLRRIAAALVDCKESFATLITDESQKPISMARGEVQRSIDLLNTVADRVDEEDAVEVHSEGLVRYLPRGVIALLTPWNNPLAIPVGQIAPALAYGNRVVWKPSPCGVRVARALAELIFKCGVAPHRVTLVEGGADVGLLVAEHPEVSAVTFTGSCGAGHILAARCHQMGRELQAELGGNNGVIAWGDSLSRGDVAKMIAHAAFGFSGQRCTAVRRLIIPKASLVVGLLHLQEAVAALPYGDPLDEATEVGPLCSAEQVHRLDELVERARPQMRSVVQPHVDTGALPLGGAYYPPTIVVCEDPLHEIVQEETFGPVLVIQPVADFDEALECLNGVRFGLTAGLVGGDGNCRAMFLEKAQAGILNLDSIHAGAGLDMPFGGWKASGLGPPQHGLSNRHFYTKSQAVYGT